MKNTAKRLILFVVAIPFLIALIWFLPHLGHLGVALLLISIGVIATSEARNLYSRVMRVPGRWTVIFGGLFPAIAWFVGQGLLPEGAENLVLGICLAWAFMAEIPRKENDHEGGIQRVGSRVLLVVYPGWFLMWIIKLTTLPQPRLILLIYMLAVFLNDSGAWFFGVLLGKHKNLFAVSPNKSLEGFLGGVFASVGVLVLAGYIFPESLNMTVGMRVLFGLAVAIATIAGDLAESALKRSSGVKDSGQVILGRGGMLDSLDSLVFAAPVFYLFLS